MAPHLQEFPAEGARDVIERELARTERKQEPATASWEDVTHILGDIDANQVSAILALKPTITELERVAAWYHGDGDVLAKAGSPLAGEAAAIFDLLEPPSDQEH